MYIFVRINAILAMILGLLLIILGIGVAAIGFGYHSQVLELANNFIMQGTGYILIDTRVYTLGAGLLLLLIGLSIASSGQLVLAYADTARNSGKLVNLLNQLVNERKPTLINNVNVNTDAAKKQSEAVVITAETKNES